MTDETPPTDDDLGPVLLRLLAARGPRNLVIPGADVFPPCETTGLLMVVGKTRGAVGASLYAREIPGAIGRVPHNRPKAALRSAAFVERLIARKLLCAAQPIGRGGLACALADMAVASNLRVLGDINIARIFGEQIKPSFAAFLFSEEPGRFLVAFPNAARQMVDSIALDMGTKDDCLMIGSVANPDYAREQAWEGAAFMLRSGPKSVHAALDLDALRAP